MKKYLFLLMALFVICQHSFSKPLFAKGKYLIGCLANGSTGTVSPGNTTYPLAFYPDRDNEIAQDSDYWAVKDLGSGKYAFQNSATLKYIQYNSASVDRTALVMADALQGDESTSFTFELKKVNNLNYYVIRSVSNTTKIWNKRAANYGGVYPVGTYTVTGADLEYFLFYDSDGNPVQDDTALSVTMPAAKPNLGAFASLMDSLTFNGKRPVVDTAKKGFYLSIPESQLSTSIVMNLIFKLKDTTHKLYINGTAVSSGATYTFQNVTGATTATLQIKKDTATMASGELYFSTLPFVQIYSDATLTATYTLGRVAVTEPDKITATESLLSGLRTRGAYASMLDKKAFSIKLKFVDGVNSLDRSFFGLRFDNNWVLDAMGIDLARMRNRVSTDLWNEFSTKPYYGALEPKMVNGTRGHFVEVFVNDSYNGLYCMTEKIDQKQLNIKKYKNATASTPVIQRGALYKADEWSFESVMGNPLYANNGTVGAYNNASDLWCNYAAKYPDLGDGEPIEWKPLRDAVVLTSYLTPDSTFKNNVAQYFDIPVIRDYYLLMELILAADNQGKNLFFSIYDQSVSKMMSITPWDMDATWGRRWDGSSNVTGPSQLWDTFVANYEHGQSNLFLRLKKLNAGGFNDLLKARYKELRGTYFDKTQLVARFQKYQTLQKNSGALAREIARWKGNRVASDANSDISYLSSWITLRLTYLDKQYLGGPYVDIENTKESKIQVFPNPVRNNVNISNIHIGASIDILSLQGAILRHTIASNERMNVDLNGLTPGIYLIKAANTTVKVIKL